jgi:hypothetical protein
LLPRKGNRGVAAAMFPIGWGALALVGCKLLGDEVRGDTDKEGVDSVLERDDGVPDEGSGVDTDDSVRDDVSGVWLTMVDGKMVFSVTRSVDPELSESLT